MKRLTTLLFAAFSSISFAQEKFSDLPAKSAAFTDEDIFAYSDMLPTPTSRKVTWLQFLTELGSATVTLTNKTIDGDNNTLSNLDIGNEVDWAAAGDVGDASAFESGDKMLVFETGVGLRKIDYDDLPSGGLGSDLASTTNDIITNAVGVDLVLGGDGAGEESLTFDFDTLADNQINISSTTGVVEVDWGTIRLNVDQIGDGGAALALSTAATGVSIDNQDGAGSPLLTLTDTIDSVALSLSGDRLFHDTNGDGTKDVGEEFIDQAGGGSSRTYAALPASASAWSPEYDYGAGTISAPYTINAFSGWSAGNYTTAKFDVTGATRTITFTTPVKRILDGVASTVTTVDFGIDSHAISIFYDGTSYWLTDSGSDEAVEALPATANPWVAGKIYYDTNMTTTRTISAFTDLGAGETIKAFIEANGGSDANNTITFPFAMRRTGYDATTTTLILQDGQFTKILVEYDGTNYYLTDTVDPGLTASDIPMARIAGSTYSTVQHMQDIFHSSGVSTGGGITDDTDGTITVAAGTGFIRATNSAVAQLLYTDWASENGANVALTDNDMNYVYVEYNSGSPQVVATIVPRTDLNTNIFLASIYRDGTELHITENTRAVVGDHALQMIERMKALQPFARESGGILGEAGTRNITVTAGTWWEGLTRFTTTATDTSAADTFSYYYQDGVGGWTEVATQSQIDNTQYDDGDGTLGTLSNNKYGVHWVYSDVSGEIYVLYGQGDYTLVEAQDSAAPAGLPPFFAESHAKLLGRIIILKSAASFTQVDSAFAQDFGGAVASDHGSLLGLGDDDHPQYLLVNGTRSMSGSLTADSDGAYTIGSDGTRFGEIYGEQLNSEVSTGIAIVAESTIASSPTTGGAGIVGYSNDGAALSSGDRLGFFLLGGYDGTTNQNTAGIIAYADEEFSGTNKGSRLELVTTPNGAGQSRATAVTIDANGGLAMKQVDIADPTGDFTVDASLGNYFFEDAVDATPTVTVSNMVDGQTIQLVLTSAAGTTFTAWTNVDSWTTGDPPALGSGDSAVYTFTRINGTTYGAGPAGTEYETVYVNAGAMIPRTTNGPATATVELATNDIMYDALDFDTTTEEGAGFWLNLPTNWDAGTVKAKFHWTTAAGAAGGVTWGIAGQSFADNDAMDSAMPASVDTDDTWIADADMHITDASAAVTVSGAAAEEAVYFEVTRVVGDTNDTMAADARLLGVTIQYGTFGAASQW